MAQLAPKRTACDRCRAHKLRCPQPERAGTGPCARCDRAGAECVTSGAKPTGRPRKAHSGQVDEPAGISGVPILERQLPEPEPGLEMSGVGGMPLCIDPVVLFGTPAGEALDPWSAFGQLQYQTMDLDPPNTGAFPEDTDTCPGSGPGPEPEGALLPDDPGTEDILIALSRLSETISQQLLRSKAFQREKDTPAETSHAPPPTSNVNGVAVALRCTADLTKILRALQSAGGKPVDTPTALLVLSSYMQLTDLFDTIFRCLCRIFREDPGAIGTCPASADSQFQVAGVSSIDGRLYVKLLIGVIEHHIEGVEKVLGLPAGLTVAGREIEDGVLSGDELRCIVDVVMSREDGLGGSGKSRILSLRSAIKEAKELL